MIWFTSDTHLGHHNIIRYDDRPFTCVDEMDQTIIDNINELVKPGDTLYHLGDFAWVRGQDRLEQLHAYRDRITCGNVHLILGNHDYRLTSMLRRMFATVTDIKTVKIGPFPDTKGMRIPVVCCHYAMRVWNRSHHGAYHLYGHSHGSLPDNPHSRSFDVGTNSWDYKPINEVQIHEVMKIKLWQPIDHHK